MAVLGIDTSGKVASVAITDGTKVLWEKSIYTKLTHSQVILPMVKQALEESELDFDKLECVAVANGPGSYTGLRIGIGAVKGMCMGCPTLKCAGVSTLYALANNCIAFDGVIVAVIRARPKIVYVGEFVCDTSRVMRIGADRICNEEEFFSTLDTTVKVMLVGDCAKEIKDKYYADNIMVSTAGITNSLQKASSVCLAVEKNPTMITTADKLEVSYLQATKAEKDKAHRD